MTNLVKKKEKKLLILFPNIVLNIFKELNFGDFVSNSNSSLNFDGFRKKKKNRKRLKKEKNESICEIQFGNGVEMESPSD